MARGELRLERSNKYLQQLMHTKKLLDTLLFNYAFSYQKVAVGCQISYQITQNCIIKTRIKVRSQYSLCRIKYFIKLRNAVVKLRSCLPARENSYHEVENIQLLAVWLNY